MENLYLELVESTSEDGPVATVFARYTDAEGRNHRRAFTLQGGQINAVKNAANQDAVLQALGRANLMAEMAQEKANAEANRPPKNEVTVLPSE